MRGVTAIDYTYEQYSRAAELIGRLAGTLVEKNPPALVLDVGGVGYELEAPMSTFYALPATGESVVLLVHMVVREDAMLLYGFATRLERTLFRELLRAKGVGARLALSILSALGADEFLASVASKDVTALVRVPGVGRKTAERLLLEMQDRVGQLGDGGAAIGVRASALGAGGGDSIRAQAEEALAALGYKPTESRRLLDRHAGEGQSVEETIRAALRGANR